MCVCQCVWAYACAPCVYITVYENNVENATQAQKVDFFIIIFFTGGRDLNTSSTGRSWSEFVASADCMV